MKFNKYHKIPQFNSVVRDLIHKSNFVGLDEDGQPVYKEQNKPTIKFKGTIKLHGTNAGVTYTPQSGAVPMKRGGLISKEKLSAHLGFNTFVRVSNKNFFKKIMSSLWKANCIEGEQITLFGEWAGAGIQKGVGISKVDKSFYVFDCKVRNIETDKDRWISVEDMRFEIPNMYSIYEFENYNVKIDFNNPKLIQNTLIEITEAVEKCCPVSKKIIGNAGEDYLGEGVVWSAIYEGEKYVFKVKGEKHSVTKVKTLAPVDPILIESVHKFVNYAVTENRVIQAMQETGAKERKDTGDFLRWMANDIISEENATLIENNLEWKQVAKDCAIKAREIFFNRIDFPQ